MTDEQTEYQRALDDWNRQLHGALQPAQMTDEQPAAGGGYRDVGQQGRGGSPVRDAASEWNETLHNMRYAAIARG